MRIKKLLIIDLNPENEKFFNEQTLNFKIL